MGKDSVGGRGLTASCGQAPGPDIKISTETGDSGLVAATSATATTLTSMLGMLSGSFLGVLVAATAATRSLSLLLGVAMASATALATGMTSSVKRCGFGDGVLAGLINGIGDLAKRDLFGRVDRH